MKTKIFLSVLLPFFSSVAFSQEIVKEGKEWNVLYVEEPHQIPIYTHYTYIIFFSGDTIINGVNYSILSRSKNISKENSEIVGFMREENGRVYARNTTSPEGLLYDFTLKTGDTVFIQNYVDYDNTKWSDSILLVVDHTKEEAIEGATRKSFYLKYLFGNDIVDHADTWYSGIGSICGLTYVGERIMLSSGGHYLLCAYEDSELIYKNSFYSNCYLAVETCQNPKIKQLATVLPNPTKDFIQIQLNEYQQDLLIFKLYDNSGKFVLQKEIKSQAEEVSVKTLPKGIYLYHLENKEKQIIQTGKIVKRK